MYGIDAGLEELLKEIEIDLKKLKEQKEVDLDALMEAYEAGYEVGRAVGMMKAKEAEDDEPGREAYQGA